MAAKVGTFTARTSTGAQAITGLGFTPKLVLIWGIRQASVDPLVAARGDYAVGFGAADGVTEFAFSFAASNSLNEAHSSKENNRVIHIDLSDGTPAGSATMSSLDSDGFTLDWQTANTGSMIFQYLAFGGADITDIAIVQHEFDLTSGSHSVTGAGFEPDGLIAVLTDDTFGIDNVVTAVFNLGFADRGLAGAFVGFKKATTSFETEAAGVGPYFLGGYDIGSSSSIQFRASLTSMDADGFTYTTVTANAPPIHGFYIAIKGGGFFVSENRTSPGSTGLQRIDAFGFTPEAVIVISHADIDDGINTPMALAAASSPTQRGGLGVWSERGEVNSGRVQRSDNLLDLLTNTGDGTKAEADLDSIDGDGITLDWTKVNGAANDFFVIGLSGDPNPVLSDVIGVGLTNAGGGPQMMAIAANDDGTLGGALPDPSPLPTGQVERIRWSHNGEWVAVGFDDQLWIYEWVDGAWGARLATVTLPDSATGNVPLGIEWNADDTMLAACHNDVASGQGLTILTWDGATLTEVHQQVIPGFLGGEATAVVWHNINPLRVFACAGTTGFSTLTAWSWNGTDLDENDSAVGVASFIIDMEFSPDGAWIGVSTFSLGSGAIPWDEDTETIGVLVKPAEAPSPDSIGTGVAWSADGTLIVFCSGASIISGYTFDAGVFGTKVQGTLPGLQSSRGVKGHPTINELFAVAGSSISGRGYLATMLFDGVTFTQGESRDAREGVDIDGVEVWWGPTIEGPGEGRGRHLPPAWGGPAGPPDGTGPPGRGRAPGYGKTHPQARARQIADAMCNDSTVDPQRHQSLTVSLAQILHCLQGRPPPRAPQSADRSLELIFLELGVARPRKVTLTQELDVIALNLPV